MEKFRMEDMDMVRNSSGTVADFSNWAVNNSFGTMKKPKLSSSERVIEPEVDEEEPGVVNKTKQFQEAKERQQMAEQKVEQQSEKRKPPFDVRIKSWPEVKELAKRLLPTVDKVKVEEHPLACELAINLAMTFEAIWNEKIVKGAENEQQ